MPHVPVRVQAGDHRRGLLRDVQPRATSAWSTCARTRSTGSLPAGIQLQDGFLDLDVIVYATGFDAMTGSLSRIDIRGRDGTSLRRRVGRVAGDLPRASACAGFPNLFTVTGPGSPSVLTNMVTSIEHHVEWITDCITHACASGHRAIEADAASQEEWAAHVNTLAGSAPGPSERATPGTSARTCRARRAATCRMRVGSPRTWRTARRWPTSAIEASRSRSPSAEGSSHSVAGRPSRSTVIVDGARMA